MPYTMSVVVPAHNEGAVLERGLAWLDDMPPGECLVVVVANGCTDDTLEAARRVAGRTQDVLVLDLPDPGKTGAIRGGDEAAGAVFPRVYLDADITVTADTMRSLRDALAADEDPLVAAPRPDFRLHSRPWVVRSFYSVFQALPYAREGLVGLGVYAVNRAGHGRVSPLPDLVADDLFVQRAFEPSERIIVDGEFGVETPRTAPALVEVRTRVARGNAQLAELGSERPGLGRTSTQTSAALKDLVRERPGRLPAVACYVGVTLLGRLRARRAGGTRWERDETTRPAVGPRRRVKLDMLEFDPLTTEDAVGHVMGALADGRGGVIVTPNVDIMQMCRRSELADLFSSADLVLADGAPVVLASRIAGTPLPGRVTGSGLVPQLADAAAENDRSVFLLGGAPGIADRAAGALSHRAPTLRVAGTLCPEYGFEKDERQLLAIESVLLAAQPDVVFVALGSPKQERLCARLSELMPQTWFLGCGAALTIAAGDIPRAPGWVQKLGAEWLHRLAREPRRLARRYLVDDLPYAVRLLTWSVRSGRRGDDVILRPDEAMQHGGTELNPVRG